MTTNQIQNLLGFYMNVNNVIKGQSLLECSPDYIQEKWKYWIGVDPTVKRNTGKFDLELKWCNKWGVNTSQYENLREVISFIIHYSKLEKVEINKIVTLYERNIGNPELISNKPLNFNGLHYFLKKICYELLEDEVNKDFMREIKLNELLT